jgi:iron complex outermembrane recepter protein
MNTRRSSGLTLHLISTLAALASAGLVPQNGLSQDTGSACADSSTNDPARLPVVTVVAQKEPQAADTLPVSVTAVTQQTLRDAGIQCVKDASVYAPNTFINQFTAPALSNPFFRGVGGSPLNPGVTTFIDGVPQLNNYSSSVELLDVDQVEFVRGPQGALFGRNTAGGLINITSRRPADLWTGGAQGSFGNYNYHDVRGTISGPIAKDELAMSVSAGYSARDGYTVNDFNGQDVDHREDTFGKGQLLFKVSDRLEMRFIAFGEHDHDGDYALGDLNYIRANPNHVDYDFTGGFNHRDVASGTFLINYFGEGVDVSSISGGVWWRNEGLTDLDYQTATAANGFLFSTRDNVEEQHQFTQEFRLSSSKDRPVQLGNDLVLSWQTGVFLFTQSYDQNAANTFTAPFPATFGTGVSTADLDDWGVGIYGQTKLTAWEKLDFIAGLRCDYEDKSAALYYNTIGLSLTPGYVPAHNLSDHFGEVSPQFSLAYHVATNQMVYGTAARGYRAGGFNPISPPGSEEYGTEHSWNYEIGYKAGWLDGKLETRLALFYIDWIGLQLNQAVGATAPGQFYIANAGGADSKGVEFSLLYRPMLGWDLFGSVGYAQANFLSGSTAYNPNLPPPGVGAVQDVSGNRLPYAPSFTGNLGTQVYWSPCRSATLYARVEVTITGDFVYDASNAQGQGTYSVANFRAGVRGSHWFVEGWVNNAFDQHYVPIAIQYGQLGAPSGYIGESGAPMTFGATLGLKF